MPGHMVICLFFPLDIVVPPGSVEFLYSYIRDLIHTVIPEILLLYLDSLVILVVVRTAASVFVINRLHIYRYHTYTVTLVPPPVPPHYG